MSGTCESSSLKSAGPVSLSGMSSFSSSLLSVFMRLSAGVMQRPEIPLVSVNPAESISKIDGGWKCVDEGLVLAAVAFASFSFAAKGIDMYKSVDKVKIKRT